MTGHGQIPISVVILTRNEEANIRQCLESCAWSDDVHVLDSNSTDRTREIAAEMGAGVDIHAFESFGQQRNWAIDNIPTRHDWVFHLDADERFTPKLVSELARVIAGNPSEAGFYVPNKLMFMGRWLKHASGYPVYQMRLFHKSRMRFEDYGHGQREKGSGPIGRLCEPYLHFNFSKGIADWLQRHNRYSTLEANEIEFQKSQDRGTLRLQSMFEGPIERRRFFKAKIYPNLPGKSLWRFLYIYFGKLGVLDGLPGLQYSLLVSTYELLISLKLAEQKRIVSNGVDSKYSGMGGSPMSSEFQDTGEPPVPLNSRDSRMVTTDTNSKILGERNTSPWTTKQKIARTLWMMAACILFRPSFHNLYAWRRMLLRLFGAKIGVGVRIRPTVRIEIPWNLVIGDYAAVGDHAILYSLGRITLGKLSSVSQYAHLCAGTHDYRVASFPLICRPITIGDEAWIATDAFIGPGVTVGNRAIVGARATVVNDVPAGEIWAGNPARLINQRDNSTDAIL